MRISIRLFFNRIQNTTISASGSSLYNNVLFNNVFIYNIKQNISYLCLYVINKKIICVFNIKTEINDFCSFASYKLKTRRENNLAINKTLIF